MTPYRTAHANELLSGLLAAARFSTWEVRAAHSWDMVPTDLHVDAYIWTSDIRDSSRHRAALRKLPNVLVSAVTNSLGGVRLCFDEAEAGRICGDFFLGRGFRSIAYLSGTSEADNLPRIQALKQCLAAHDASLKLRVVSASREIVWFGTASQRSTRPVETHWIEMWLKILPKPAGIICRSDEAALRLLQRCKRLSIPVPEEISLLGIGNDSDISLNADPAISSLEFDFRALGAKAFDLIEHYPADKTAEPLCLFPPGAIIERDSTAFVGSADPVILKAVEYIRRNLGDVLSVNDITRYCGVSRVTLNNRFVSILGRSPGREIKRQRLSMARTLLANTSLPIKEIGHRCGMPDPYHFSTFFRRGMGTSPKQWRERRHHHARMR